MPRVLPSWLLLFLAAALCPAGTVLWYNGDWDDVSAYGNAQTPPGLWRSYDDFVVPPGGWTISAVFSSGNTPSGSWPHPLIPTSAAWEIRSGMTEGDLGTLVAGGATAAFTWTDSGSHFWGTYDLYSLWVGGLSVSLSGGRYYLTLYPISDDPDAWSYLATTSGANAIGLPPGNQAGFQWQGANFFQRTLELTYGVEGVGIPEPATFLLIGVGLSIIGLKRRT